MRHTFEADVKSVKNLIGEKYKSGFPIIKELMQNANDSGANNLIIGFTDGLSNAKHPLIKNSPAMYIINDGAFSAKDAIAIDEIISDNKDHSITIGKFGLGLKSLFHYCEGYFYLCNKIYHLEELHSLAGNAQDKYSQSMNFVTPWDDEFDKSSPYHHWIEELTKYRLEDYSEITHKLRCEIQHFSDWFIIWVPLRTKENTVDNKTIGINFYDQKLNKITEQYVNIAFSYAIADILPLMGSLHTVELVSPYLERIKITHKDGTSISLDEIVEAYNKQTILQNHSTDRVSIITKTSTYMTQTYLESFLSKNPKLFDIYMKRNENQEDKSLPPHGGVLFTISDFPDAKDCLVIQKSSFLPLSDRQIDSTEIHRYNLYLHGCFFMDSGRQDIFLTEQEDSNLPSEEVSWNRYLLADILSKVIPTLDSFSHTYQLNHSALKTITSAIITELPIYLSQFPEYQDYLYSEFYWVERAMSRELQWSKIKKTEFYLISSEYTKYSVRINSFIKLLDQKVFLCDAAISMINREASPWDLSFFKAFWDINFIDLITDEQFRSFWVSESRTQYDLLSEDMKRPIEELFIKSVKQQLSTLQFKVISDNTNIIATIMMSLIDSDRYVYTLNIDTLKLFKDINNVVNAIILPKSKENTYNNIAANDAYHLLEFLSKSQYKKELHRITAEILTHTNTSELDPQFKQLLIFQASDINRNELFVSLNEIESCLYVAGNTSRANISMINSAFIDADVRTVGIFGGSEYDISKLLNTVDTLTEKSFLKFYNTKLANFKLSKLEHRLPLLTFLINGLNSIDDTNICRVIRYIFSNKDNLNNEAPLYIYQSDNFWFQIALAIAKYNFDDHDRVILVPPGMKMSKEDQRKLNIDVVNDDVPGTLLNQEIPNDVYKCIKNKEAWKDIYTRISKNTLLFNLPIFKTIEGHFISINSHADKEIFMVRDAKIADNLPLENVILLNYDKILADYNPPIKQLEDKEILKKYLSCIEPHCYMAEIMSLLNKLDTSDLDIYQLRTIRWIAFEGMSYAPTQVLHHQFYDNDIEEILHLYNQLNNGQRSFISSSSLSEEMLNHASFPKIKELLFLDEMSVFSNIGDIVGNIPIFCIVKSELIPTTLEFYKQCFALIDALPINIYLKKWITHIKKEYLETYVIPNLFKKNPPISTQKIVLNGIHENLNSYAFIIQPSSTEMYLEILSCYLNFNQDAKLLNYIKLWTEDGKWISASKLCLHDAIIPESGKVDNELNALLSKFEFIPQPLPRFDVIPRSYMGNEDVKKYLLEIGNSTDVEKDLIGVFLSFLCDANPIWRRYAEELFLSLDKSVDSIRNRVLKDWQKELEHELIPLDKRFEEINVNLTLQDLPDKCSVTSLTGDEIQISTFSTLHSDQFDVNYPTYNFYMFKLDVNTTEKLDELLHRFVDFVVRKIFSLLPNQSFIEEKIWKVFEKSSQLNIKIAQKVIQQDLVSIFKRFNIGSANNDVLRLLRDHDNLNHERAIEEFNNQNESSIYQEREGSIRKSASELIMNTDVQVLLINSIKKEIKAFQYAPESVLFELFQNADDAYVEKDSLQLVTEESNYEFRITTHDRNILIIHKGRNINEMRGNTAGGKQQWGYGHDLHKMLTMNYSDKRSEDVTGKFGLGFKSIYLICDNPIIVSGKLCFSIQGGVYPVELDSESRNKYFQEYSNSHDYTIFDLSVNEDIDIESLIDVFRAQSVLLPVFSKRINKVMVDDETILHNIQNINDQISYIPYLDHVIVIFRGMKWQLAIEMTNDGFIGFSNVKQIWVTVPTDTITKYPIAINGQFAIDIGRRQLAYNTNQEAMDIIGKEFASILNEERLVETISKSTEIQIDNYIFWDSLFQILTCSDKRQAEDTLSAVDSIFWRNAEFRYCELLNTKSILPNRLDEYPQLTCLNNVEYIVESGLNNADFLNLLLQNGIEIDSVISSAVHDRIKLLVDTTSIEIVNLNNFLEVVSDTCQIDNFLAQSFSDVLSKHPEVINQHEFREYNRRILFFMNSNQDWCPIEKLIHSGYKDADLLRKFIDNDYLIDDSYSLTCNLLLNLLGDENTILVKNLLMEVDSLKRIYALKYYIRQHLSFPEFYQECKWIHDINPGSELYIQLTEIEQRQFDEIINETLATSLDLDSYETYSFLWFKTITKASCIALQDPSDQGSDERSTVKLSFHDLKSNNRLLTLNNPNRYLLPLYDVTSPDNVAVSFESKERKILAKIQGFEIKNSRIEVLFEQSLKPDLCSLFSKYTTFWVELNGYKNVSTAVQDSYAALSVNFADSDSLLALLPKDIDFVFGPPGTGKTYELSERIIKLKESIANILVLTPTNKSADELCEKIMAKNTDFTQWLVRFGNCINEKIQESGCVNSSGTTLNSKTSVTITTAIRFPYDGYRNNKFKDKNWDYIIIDEASMIPIHYITYVIHKGNIVNPNCKFIIAGDPFQIPPIYNFPKTANNKKLNELIENVEDKIQEENIYSMVNLMSFCPEIQESNINPHPFKISNLNTQYRSVEPIGRLFSRYCYDDLLEHDRKITSKQLANTVSYHGVKVNYINVVTFPLAGGEIYRAREVGDSHAHPYSALLIAEYLQAIDESATRTLEIGILSAYRPQVLMISKILSKYNFKHLDVQVDTVHGFQGGQKEIMFCVFNPPIKYPLGQSPKISCRDRALINRKYIINVGISRAKDALFILIPDSFYETNDGLKSLRGYGNLRQISDLKDILSGKYFKEYTSYFKGEDIEKAIFNRKDHIYDESILIGHDQINVYRQAPKKFLISYDPNSIDVQIKSPSDA